MEISHPSNAARVMLERERLDDLGAQVEGRPAARLGAVCPELDARFPSTVPAAWLGARR